MNTNFLANGELVSYSFYKLVMMLAPGETCVNQVSMVRGNDRVGVRHCDIHQYSFALNAFVATKQSLAKMCVSIALITITFKRIIYKGTHIRDLVT